MKICILLYHLDLGGVEKTAVDLANELVDAGHEVDIQTIYKFKPSMFNIDPRINLKKFIGTYFKGLNDIISLLPTSVLYRLIVGNKKKYDVEIAFQAELPTSIISASTNQKSKKLAWVHGLGLKYSDIYDKFDRVFFVSKDLMSYNMLNNFPKKNHDKLKVLYNPLDFDEIKTKSIENFSYKGNKETIRFITVGRLSAEKRFDRLIDAFYLVNKYQQNTSLEIVGSGRLSEELNKKVENLGLQTFVTFHGYSSNPYKYLKNSDIYVCSSDNEGFNVAMTEAGIIGLPIISTNVFGASELLGNNDDFGLVVEKETESLSAGMKRMLDEENRLLYSGRIKDRVDSIFINERNEQLSELFDIIDNLK